MPVISGVTYSSPVVLEDVASEDLRTIWNIPLLRLQDVLADAQSVFVALDGFDGREICIGA